MVRWTALAVWITLALSRPALAWGPSGHVIVARLAEKHLDARTKRALRGLLDGRALSDVASWADDWRGAHPETAGWHFVDIPLGADSYEAARDCPRDACIVAALAAETAKLRSRATPRAERQRALRFVVHLVGDLHQPLHTADDGDKGGNRVAARLVLRDEDFPYQSQEKSNLHGVWDNDLLESKHRDQSVYVAELAALPEPAARMRAGSVLDWVLEAHLVARKCAYDLPAADPATGARELGPAYVARCRPQAELQLQRAGVRLARVLNEAFAAP